MRPWLSKSRRNHAPLSELKTSCICPDSMRRHFLCPFSQSGADWSLLDVDGNFAIDHAVEASMSLHYMQQHLTEKGYFTCNFVATLIHCISLGKLTWIDWLFQVFPRMISRIWGWLPRDKCCLMLRSSSRRRKISIQRQTGVRHWWVPTHACTIWRTTSAKHDVIILFLFHHILSCT